MNFINDFLTSNNCENVIVSMHAMVTYSENNFGKHSIDKNLLFNIISYTMYDPEVHKVGRQLLELNVPVIRYLAKNFKIEGNVYPCIKKFKKLDFEKIDEIAEIPKFRGWIHTATMYATAQIGNFEMFKKYCIPVPVEIIDMFMEFEKEFQYIAENNMIFITLDGVQTRTKAVEIVNISI